jgi:carbamoyl-phosphate synthase large subunit
MSRSPAANWSAVVVQLGGQTPAQARGRAGAGRPSRSSAPSPDAIDLAEDRERFANLVHRLGLRQPENGLARSREEAIAVAERIGYPVLTRPSYVLGRPRDGDRRRPRPAQIPISSPPSQVSGDSPVLIDQYLRDAIEVDVDAISDGKDVAIAGVMQHIEEAGVHSGDSACSLPPYSLPADIVAEIERQTRQLALALGVVGLMNVQFAVKDGLVYLIEVNPRASRTVPFVAKAIGTPIAKIAARVMAGDAAYAASCRSTATSRSSPSRKPYSPSRAFPGHRSVLSPEMKSTGEVMGIADDFPKAYLKAGTRGRRAAARCRHPVRVGLRTATRGLKRAARSAR